MDEDTPEQGSSIEEGGEPRPRPPSITQVTPIGGALAGGITATLSGRGFQPGAEVFFGASQSPKVTYESAFKVLAVVPASTQTGSVNVTLVNPDGTDATKAGGFTYVTTEAALHAEVLGVTPPSVIEDTETEVTIRGRNLLDAYTNGFVALRGPTRATVNILSFTSRDAAPGIEDLVFTLRITASPPLGSLERMAVQVLASRRPGAASDGVFESSRHFFTVLPKALPVTLAFTQSLEPDRPTLVVVAGRNLEGCTLDFGMDATVHMQKSDDRNVVGVVSLPEGVDYSTTAPPQLVVRDASGGEVAQYEMQIAAGGEAASANVATAGEAATADSDFVLTLTPTPDQQMVAPTEEDSAVFNLRSATPASYIFDSFNFVFDIFEWDFEIVIVNEVRLIPFFDGGGSWRSPVLARVGRLFRVRGAGLLLALRINFVIQIRVILIIGFRYNIWDFGLFNEFSGLHPWALGSIVVGIRIFIRLLLLISWLVALVRPDGRLHVISQRRLVFGIDFDITLDGRGLHFDPDFIHQVRPAPGGVSPQTTTLFPCEGRFQLAEENGQTAFTDADGGSQSFYFPRAAGRCCLSWNFNLSLVRFAVGGGPDETLQEGFRTEFCLDAVPNPDPMDVLIVSTRTPHGFPPPLRLEIGEHDTLKALGRPVDERGVPIPGAPWQDLTTMGFRVEFFLAFPEAVLNTAALPAGDADAILPGENVIRVAASRLARVIEEDIVDEFGFWPGAVLGFDIVNFLSRGLMPAVRIGDLPVIVNPPPATVTVELTLAYWVEPTKTGGARTLNEADEILDSNGNRVTFQGQTLRELQRYEPFEQNPRVYVLAAKIVAIQDVTADETLTFQVSSAQMRVLDGNYSPVAATPLGGAGYSSTSGLGETVTIDREGVYAFSKFFSGGLVGATSQNTFTARINPTTTPGKLVEIEKLNVRPNSKEQFVGTPPELHLVPPGVNVTGRHVALSVGLSVQPGNVTVTLRNSQAHGVVTNGENYEEYLRVLIDAQNLLAGADAIKKTYADSADNFLKDLNAAGHGDAVLRRHGDDLWTHAFKSVQGTGGKGLLQDDRQLYIARLQCIGALRAYAKRKGIRAADDVEKLILKFERPSRGFEQGSGAIVIDSATDARKAVVTGFDPFGFPGWTVETRTRGNPSGLIALWFNAKEITGQPSARVRTAIFPVRYKEFDDGWVEAAVNPSLNKIVMLMTCSENGSRDLYDIERWAGKNRADSIDNNRKPATGTPILRESPLRVAVRDPIGSDEEATQFLESTLPYERVITRDDATRALPGPATTATMPFVTDQSYEVLDRTSNTPTAGEFRPAPPDASEDESFVKQTDKPDNSKLARRGSGGNYLSNEIFYRTALRRDKERPARMKRDEKLKRDEKPSALNSGHFHIPSFVTPSAQNTETAQRERLIQGAGKAIESFLKYCFRLTAEDLKFPATPVNTTSAPLRKLNVKNETKEAIRISAIEATAPFAVQLPSPPPTAQAPITLNEDTSSITLLITFAPTTLGTKTGTLTIREPGGEVLLEAALTGEGVAAHAIAGRVTLSGAAFPGVLVTLSGSAAATATTGADGRYSFPAVAAGGAYTVTPSHASHTFTPPSYTFNNLSADQVADFAAIVISNVALASGGANVTASSQYDSSFPVEAATNGDRFHLHLPDGRLNIWHSAADAPKPDWLQVEFAGPMAVSEVVVTTQQDDYNNPVDPTEQLTFTKYGLRDFEVQYWGGSNWVTVPGGSVTGNDRVLRKFTFPPIVTTKMRLRVTATADGFTRVMEFEAWGRPPATRTNVALASNGGVATASSQYNASFPVEAAVNGDRYHLHLPDGRLNIWHSAAGAPKPDWLQVEFSSVKIIDEIVVVTQQDDYNNPVDPTEATTFTLYGLRDFDVQYWDGAQWVTVPGGSVTGNNRVLNRFTFPSVTTSKIRVLVSATADGFTRVMELEAYQPAVVRTNVALASNGATVAASSQYSAIFPVEAAINGDRYRLFLPDGRYNIWHSAAGAAKPDWLEVTFAGPRAVSEVNITTQQDDYNTPVDPTEALTFTKYGLRDFEVQYWDGSQWVTVPGGSVTGNNKVWRRFVFAPVTTTKMRVLAHATADGFTRVMEFEAWSEVTP